MLALDNKSASVKGKRHLEDGSAAIWKQIAEPAQSFLQSVAIRLSDQVNAFDPKIADYAKYALNSQGKQLRPVLVGLSGSSLDKLQDSHVIVAVIIEMVHLATLVHDDVLDEAAIRRGRSTLAAKWGNDISVLLGDCLFAHALVMAAGFPTTDICRAVASATNTVCAGEILQTQQRRNFKFTQADYFKVLAMKTGELFALSCEMGAFLSQATPLQRGSLRQYGMSLGTAYQVYDDCVDLFASEKQVGKSLGTDLAKGKLTLPVLLLLEQLSVPDRVQVQNMIVNWDTVNFPRLLDMLAEHKTLEGAQKVIHGYLNTARKNLDCLPENESRDALFSLTEFLAQQTRALGGAG